MLSPEVRAFLQEPRFAVLATIGADGSPQQSVMWYELRDDLIIMNTAEGRVKTTNLRNDPRVSLCIEDGYRYVTLVGRVEFDDDQETAQADIAALALRYHGPGEETDQQIAQFRQQHRVTLVMSIDKVITHGV